MTDFTGSVGVSGWKETSSIRDVSERVSDEKLDSQIILVLR
jgi:hypothetical protein